MRINEIRGLGVEAVGNDQIEIVRPREQGNVFKEAKCGSARTLPLHGDLSDALGLVMARSNPVDILLQGGHSKALPLSTRVIENCFREVLLTIGISDEERNRHNLRFLGGITS